MAVSVPFKLLIHRLYLTNQAPMTKTQTTSSVNAIVLAAGLGTRMKSTTPKVLHQIAGRTLVNHVLSALTDAGVTQCVVVVSDGAEEVKKSVSPQPIAVQKQQLGTGDAVKAALPSISEDADDVLVLFGADPLITSGTISAMIERRRQADNPAVVVLGFRPPEAGNYGRLVTDDGGNLEAIVEAKDATSDQLEIDLCNSGVMAIDGNRIHQLVNKIDNKNAKGEFYLTDIVALAIEEGGTCAWVEGDPDELLGVDTRADLANAEQLMQIRLRNRAMEGGVTLIDPNSAFFAFDTKIGRDVVIGPNVVFGPSVVIDDNVEIKAFSHIEGATVSSGAVIGPYARLRPGADIGTGAKVGNFVEVKNAVLGSGAKANHLSYIGDADIGANANIGAGTITCNYDGFLKSRTVIGEGAFIGSNSALVAPVNIGDGAIVGAGSAISKDVASDDLAVTRAPQKSIAGWASRFRADRLAKKNAPKK
jgi:bifunctional UDP-N-acetylglucosamine pyrophosphorylase/glucosamine-1-phosphate N-acetyltransferase